MSKFVLPSLRAVEIDGLIQREQRLFPDPSIYTDEELEAKLKEYATKLNR